MKPETLFRLSHDTRTNEDILNDWVKTYNAFLTEYLEKESLGNKLIERINLAYKLIKENNLEDNAQLDGAFCFGNEKDALLFQDYFQIKDVVAFQFDVVWMVDPGSYTEENYNLLIRTGFKEERQGRYYEAYQAYNGVPDKRFNERGYEVLEKNNQIALEYLEKGINLYNQQRYSEAYLAFMEAADRHNSEACLRIGILAASGIGCSKSIDEAYQYLKEATLAENESACNVIVELYDQGALDIPGEEAWNYCMKAAKLGSKEAQVRLKKGFDLRSKDLILKDKAKSGDSDAMFKLYKYYLKDNNQEEACNYLIEAGALDNVDALLELASISLKTNLADARRYYEKAAKLKSIEAMLALAKLDRGEATIAFFEAVPNDNTYISLHKKEFDWYLKAADLGYVPAMTYVAKAYLVGYPIVKNIDDAFSYAAKAANAGDYFAYYLIGYINEYSDDPDMPAAILFYTQAADKGVYSAMMRLYDIYANGLKGIMKDEIKAKHYLFMSGGGRE